LEIIRRAVDDAGIDMADVDVVAYTKGRSESGSSKISVEREDG
jgi:tRNA A37 threonylcarbamoyltransferase TsaD